MNFATLQSAEDCLKQSILCADKDLPRLHLGYFFSFPSSWNCIDVPSLQENSPLPGHLRHL